MATKSRPTKAEQRRARALAAKAAIARAERQARNRRIALWSGVGLVVIALVVVAVVVLNRSDDSTTPTASSTTSGSSVTSGAPSAASETGRTTNPPWNAPADATAAVTSAGLSMLGEEGNAVHIHTHLDVFANGAAVTVPAEIGIDEAKHKISPLHSHDTTGVIHVESPTSPATFTLGQFFGEWQVSLGADHIGGLKADDTHHLKVYVNGTLREGDPASIVLVAHDEIAIVYGTDAQQVNVPKSYQWTNGL